MYFKNMSDDEILELDFTKLDQKEREKLHKAISLTPELITKMSESQKKIIQEQIRRVWDNCTDKVIEIMKNGGYENL